MNLPALPAVAVMDERLTLRGVVAGIADEKRWSDFLAAAIGDGPAPGPFPERPVDKRKPETPQPLRDGIPAAWLTVGTWLGPAGLSREGTDTEALLPGIVELDYGPAPNTGYYAVHPTLYAPDGRTIAVYPPDGFSVVRGTAAQDKRRETKKLALSYYWCGSGSSYKSIFPWMKLLGISRNIGSQPSFPVELGEAAKKANIMLTADFYNPQKYSLKEVERTAKTAAPYTRWFKSYNEVDIRPQGRSGAEWVNRVKAEYETAKAARPDAFYVGGSLVRPFNLAGPTNDGWLVECLKLGLDKYQDAWDVHAYPILPPVLGGSLANSSRESDLGVENCYRALGKSNSLPFWWGEVGAYVDHGYDGRRWQAETSVKMISAVASREDYQVIAFCAAHMNANIARAGYVSGHMPTDAALYTAGALIDGLPYTRLGVGDKHVQAALFGPTRMLWSPAGRRKLDLTLDAAGPWVMVDVVGRVRDLPVSEENVARIEIAGSPVYVLRRSDYDRLTAFK